MTAGHIIVITWRLYSQLSYFENLLPHEWTLNLKYSVYVRMRSCAAFGWHVVRICDNAPSRCLIVLGVQYWMVARQNATDNAASECICMTEKSNNLEWFKTHTWSSNSLRCSGSNYVRVILIRITSQTSKTLLGSNYKCSKNVRRIQMRNVHTHSVRCDPYCVYIC